MREVKRCPFCGQYPVCGVDPHEGHLEAVIRCTRCNYDRRVDFGWNPIDELIPFSDFEIAFDRVVDAWNERYTEE